MSTISASEARQTLPAQLDRVEAGEQVAITRHGKVVAVLVQPEVLRTRRAAGAWARADEIADLLEDARHKPIPSASVSVARVHELIEDVRAQRSAR